MDPAEGMTLLSALIDKIKESKANKQTIERVMNVILKSNHH